MNNVQRAEEIATKAHEGTFRRDGVTPYIVHPRAVAAMVDTEEEKIVAWLHDVLEDTTTTQFDLMHHPRLLLSDCELCCLESLVHLVWQSYEEYIAEIVYLHKRDGWYQSAINVKIADIVCNLSDNPTEKQKKKYYKALKILAGAE